MEHEKIYQISLDQLCEGEYATLLELPQMHPLAGRLRDMGWLCGSRIQCVHGGERRDPIVYRVAGVTVALRASDAANIRVSCIKQAAAFLGETEDIVPAEDGCIYGAYGDYGSEDDVGNLLKGGDTYETAR